MFPKLCQIVPCVAANILWKFNENLVIHFTVMLPTNTLRSLHGRPWNSLSRSDRVSIIICSVVPDISWKFHENPSTRFSKASLTNTDLGNIKNRPWSQGVNRNISKMFQIVPCFMPEFCWKSLEKNPYIRCLVVLLTVTDLLENTEKETRCSSG